MFVEIVKMVVTFVSMLLILFLVVFFGARFFNTSANICNIDEQCMVYELSCCPDKSEISAFNKGYKTSLNIEKGISCWTDKPDCGLEIKSTLNLTNEAYCTPQHTCAVRPDCEAVCTHLAELTNEENYEQLVLDAEAFACEC